MPKAHKSKRHPLYPEPGAWVLRKTRGLPELEPPSPLPKDKLSGTDVSQHIAYEGLGFCVYEFISPEKIADNHLAKLWADAKLALQGIIVYLETLPNAEEKTIRRPLKRRNQTSSRQKTGPTTLGQDATEQDF